MLLTNWDENARWLILFLASFQFVRFGNFGMDQLRDMGRTQRLVSCVLTIGMQANVACCRWSRLCLQQCWPCPYCRCKECIHPCHISQNLAHLEGNSHKNFKSHRIFRPFYNRFYEEININHTLLWFSQASYMKNKDFRLYWGSFKVIFKKISQNFVKSPLKFCLISQILVHSL